MEKKVGDLYKVVEDLETTVDDLSQCLRHDCVELILHKPSSRSILGTRNRSCNGRTWHLNRSPSTSSRWEQGEQNHCEILVTGHSKCFLCETKDSRLPARKSQVWLPLETATKARHVFGIAVPLPKEALWRVITSLSSQLRQINYNLIYPYFSYSIVAWGSAYRSNI